MAKKIIFILFFILIYQQGYSQFVWQQMAKILEDSYTSDSIKVPFFNADSNLTLGNNWATAMGLATDSTLVCRGYVDGKLGELLGSEGITREENTFVLGVAYPDTTETITTEGRRIYGKNGSYHQLVEFAPYGGVGLYSGIDGTLFTGDGTATDIYYSNYGASLLVSADDGTASLRVKNPSGDNTLSLQALNTYSTKNISVDESVPTDYAHLTRKDYVDAQITNNLNWPTVDQTVPGDSMRILNVGNGVRFRLNQYPTASGYSPAGVGPVTIQIDDAGANNLIFVPDLPGIQYYRANDARTALLSPLFEINSLGVVLRGNNGSTITNTFQIDDSGISVDCPTGIFYQSDIRSTLPASGLTPKNYVNPAPSGSHTTSFTTDDAATTYFLIGGSSQTITIANPTTSSDYQVKRIKNTGSTNWTVAGNVVNLSGTTITTLNSHAALILDWDGTNWVSNN